MQQLNDKVAVITGAASGIGRSVAHKCAAQGMKLVLGDIEEKPLAAVAATLQEQGADVVAQRCDVAQEADVQALADAALAAFGGVHLLFNNAGVAWNAPLWETTFADWEWVLGVNLWGVIHGCRIFTPLMLAQDEPSHIVNMASMAGMVASPGLSIYNVSKFGVVALSESLYFDLQQIDAPVGVSVVCPGWVNTRIVDAPRNRPQAMQNDTPVSQTIIDQALATRKLVADGLSPADAAQIILDGVRDNRFYIFTHPDWLGAIHLRTKAMLNDQPPPTRPRRSNET